MEALTAVAVAGPLTITEPMIVPTRALATVNPRVKLVSWKTSVSASVVPEMTAVSKPKSRPPSEATIVLRRRVTESDPARPPFAIEPAGSGPGAAVCTGNSSKC